ncbi:tRNA threonylcarbamoyladenosine dehydratase [Kingella negevensis]|uniref:tRNA threonylcarbamoyladenosine dehydratase n=1 Tax=Kingella negevensis TaxID=1522312 RepID=A0A238HIU4_9NEIS|nr:tRNA threonylcarbamoyladenosine dehydratase [Kingella negevensis]MDK4685536.1 tRNA threonylcarbamoyladenosine dehydratase [Kingella negevensis]MDK4688882.1 tRNA threonylcarbamoyladenosine dehydratase [Kingella negevensis]MDK4697005.1 tRNA threonylcarbamoyladenosine dehydratase [Kingella negevensis]WII92063.1 tRNA threonylcarbamoyladenosine dehydratase [Kingella negevensis]SNB78344.1 tRNA threonylcarbamoyladenosine dehydratase [Kingella negevensis]
MTSSTEYNRRFGGIARLYGEHGLQALQKAHVCVVGVGGVGSWAVEALARSGVGELTLIDLDNIAVSNVNRQLHALTSDFGKPKVTALRERIAEINPDCVVHEIEDFVDEDNLAEIFRLPFDFVIDAIDQVRVKVAMVAHFVRKKQAFIMSGGAGGQRNPALIELADLSETTHDPLLSNLRYTLRKKHGFARTGKMRVPCVYSREQITPPQIQAACDVDNAAPQGLSCAGYGASMLVTASFGLHCATAAIEHIVKQANKKAA